MTDREQQIVDESLREFSQLQTQRNTFAAHWEETALITLPTSRNTFNFGDFNWGGEKKTDRQVDATGMMALQRFGAICDSLLTPRNMQWHSLTASNPYVRKDRATQIWFQQVTDILFQYRYNPLANFSSQNQNNFISLGAFGNAGMYIDELDVINFPGARGTRYKAVPLGELFFHENHQGIVDGVVRWFRMTPRQCWQKCQWWGEPERFPATLKPALDQQSEMPVDFIHRVVPRSDYDPGRLDSRGKPWTSYYISLNGKMLIHEGGYNSFPYAVSRYDQTPGEVYGRGPAQQVLPALKTLNAEKRVYLKAGHRAADPPLLTTDDGIVDFNLTPGALNAGGVSADGQMLVHPFPVGNIQISKEMMQEERQLINDAFLVTLFQILTETPTMTATEVIERTNEKGILIAPTMGRQQSEYLGPMIERELDVLSNLGLLPPMPPRLKEAKGEYQVVYTSPLSKSMKAAEVAGFFRTVEQASQVASQVQDPSIMDIFDFPTAFTDVADIQAVPPTWMSSPGQLQVKRKGRAAMQAQQMKIQAAPAQAALMKAAAVQQKNGVAPQQGQQQPQGPQGQ